MPDERYIECRGCGARDQVHVDVTYRAAPGDGVPWLDTSRVIDTHDWECQACGLCSTDRAEVCFVGYPGITDDEKEAQRHE